MVTVNVDAIKSPNLRRLNLELQNQTKDIFKNIF